MTVRIAKQLQGFKYDTVKQREVADTNLSSAASKLVCIQKIKSWHLRSDVGYLAKSIGKFSDKNVNYTSDLPFQEVAIQHESFHVT